MSLLTTIQVIVSANLTSALDLATANVPLTYKKTIELTSGVGANQADKVFSDQRTLAASANESLDLAGSLVDALGVTISFARIKAILIVAADGNTNNVQVGGAASNQFLNWVADATDVVNIRPGGVLLLVAKDATGYAVTAATGDLLKIANSGAGTGVTYDVVIVGCSA